jgi:hypothetical protein
MLLFLVSVRTLSKAKISVPDYCKNMMPGKAYSLYKKKTNLYDTRNCCSKNFKHQPKPTIEYEKAEELMRKPMHRQFYWVLEGPSVDKEKTLAW